MLISERVIVIKYFGVVSGVQGTKYETDDIKYLHK
jgi:hypothetical protein